MRGKHAIYRFAFVEQMALYYKLRRDTMCHSGVVAIRVYKKLIIIQRVKIEQRRICGSALWLDCNDHNFEYKHGIVFGLAIRAAVVLDSSTYGMY